MTNGMDPMDALAGLKVLDLSQGIAGPFCAKLLADHGADVLKVEPPDGEAGRRMPPFHEDDPHIEKSLFFLLLNLNKRGVTLALDRPEGVALFKQLVAQADIVVENFAPGYLASIGLGYDALRALRPDLLMTSITPFGQTGPQSGFAGGEIVAYAASGIMSISGTSDRAPLKHGGFQAQYQAGLSAAVATQFALLQRDLDGEGEHIDVSIQEVVASTMVGSQTAYAWAGAVSGRRAPTGTGLGNVMPCKDGYFVAQASWRGGSAAWDTLMAFFDRPELSEPRFADPQQRVANARELEQVFRSAASERRKAEMFRTASEKHRMLLGIVQTPQDLAQCPQLEARDFYTELEHPVMGRLRVPFRLWNMSGTPARLRRSAPLLGEHNHAVYGELGLNAARIAALHDAGVV